MKNQTEKSIHLKIDVISQCVKKLTAIKISLDNFLKNNLDEEYHCDLMKMTMHHMIRFMRDLEDYTGKFLHNLSEEQPGEETLKSMIDLVPTCLKQRNHIGRIPILSAASSPESVRYVSILAEKAIEHKVLSRTKRGGLLVVDPLEILPINVLQILVAADTETNSNQDCSSNVYHATMKKLRARNLVNKQDIKGHNLLYHACQSRCRQTLDYLLEWEPDALKTHTHRGRNLGQAIIEDGDCIDDFKTFFATSIKYHPGELGLLFQKSDEGKTLCEDAFDEYGKEETFQVIGRYIPFCGSGLPILHYVAIGAPQCMDDFTKYYTSSVYTRDKYGRTLREAELQIKLASGTQTFQQNSRFFTDMNPMDLRAADPTNNGLYPFMVAASEQTSDLDAVYYLLRRDPSVAYKVASSEQNPCAPSTTPEYCCLQDKQGNKSNLNISRQTAAYHCDETRPAPSPSHSHVPREQNSRPPASEYCAPKRQRFR